MRSMVSHRGTGFTTSELTFDGEVVDAADLHHPRAGAERVQLRDGVLVQVGVAEDRHPREGRLTHLLPCRTGAELG